MMRHFSSSGWGLIGLALALANLAPLHAAPAPDQRAADKAERMAAWRRLRFGLFIHWGPYSELGGTYNGKAYPGNTEWIMRSAEISRADYREAAKQFDPKAYDPAAIVSFAKDCGFKYIIMTAKHYDGFAMFDSKASDFNSVAVLPSKRDLLMEFSKACKDAGMPLGLSYTIGRDWYHPGGSPPDEKWDASQAGSRDGYLSSVAVPQLRELAANYGPISEFLLDSTKGIPVEIKSRIESILNSRTVMPRDFSGGGDYHYTDGVSRDHALSTGDWAKCTSLGNSWGYRKGAVKYQSSDSLILELVSTVSKGGNYLLNVGLDGDGRMPEAAEKSLKGVGDWLSQYGEAIYGTTKSPFVSHSWNGTATVRDLGRDGSELYLFLFGEEARKSISLSSLITEPTSAESMTSGQKISVLGFPGHWQLDTSNLKLQGNLSVLKIHLSGPPVLGSGPIVSDDQGRLNLAISRGNYPDKRTSLNRTALSADLELTSFTDSAESGIWELYTTAEMTVKMQLKMAAPVPAQGKKIILWLADKKLSEMQLKPEEGQSDLPVFLSSSFRLPAGSNHIRISGSEDDKNPASISTSDIELIPCN